MPCRRVACLGQVLLISFFLPGQLLRRMQHVVETYPPTEYSRLYPVSIDSVERAQRSCRDLNRVALLVGLSLVGVDFLVYREDRLVA